MTALYPQPVLADLEIYRVDENLSRLCLTPDPAGAGCRARIRGKIILDRAARIGALDVSISTPAAGATEPEQPVVQYRSTRLHFRDDVPVSVDGEIFGRGVVRPLTLHFTRFSFFPGNAEGGSLQAEGTSEPASPELAALFGYPPGAIGVSFTVQAAMY